MIGTRASAAALTTLVAVVLGFGPGAPRPEVALEAHRLVGERLEVADVELAALAAMLDDALETARSGAAAVLGGTEPPGPRLIEAGRMLTDAVADAQRAADAVAALESAGRAASPDVEPLPAGVDPTDLGSIGVQLGGTATAADVFAAMRLRAARVAATLDEALAALTDDDLDAADAAVAAARADHAAVAGWDAGFPTLPIWVETADATIGAVERLLDGVRRGDDDAAREAAADFAALSDDATDADRALQIAMSEGAGSVTAAPLSRLVRAIEALGDQRATVARLYSGSVSLP